MKKTTITKTVVNYMKDGTKYAHTFPGNLPGSEAERKMIMEKRVGRSQIISISHQ
jgi:hypothetical protein